MCVCRFIVVDAGLRPEGTPLLEVPDGLGLAPFYLTTPNQLI